jgi:hypothetical protein
MKYFDNSLQATSVLNEDTRKHYNSLGPEQ